MLNRQVCKGCVDASNWRPDYEIMWRGGDFCLCPVAEVNELHKGECLHTDGNPPIKCPHKKEHLERAGEGDYLPVTLSKKLCKRCFCKENKKWDIGWEEFREYELSDFENNWSLGYLSCPVASTICDPEYDSIRREVDKFTYDIEEGIPSECPYAIEHHNKLIQTGSEGAK